MPQPVGGYNPGGRWKAPRRFTGRLSLNGDVYKCDAWLPLNPPPTCAGLQPKTSLPIRAADICSAIVIFSHAFGSHNLVRANSCLTLARVFQENAQTRN
jgi:hypothetical protein